MAKALDGDGIPGGWGIYRLSPGGDLEPFSIPNGGRAMAFWSDGDGTLFLLTEEGRFLLTPAGRGHTHPVAAWGALSRGGGAPHHRCSHSLTALSASCPWRLSGRAQPSDGAWGKVDFTADTFSVLPRLPLGAPLPPGSACAMAEPGWPSLCPSPHRKSEYFLPVYTARQLGYPGGLHLSLYGNHPRTAIPWGSWQDRRARSIALGPSLPGTGNCLLTNSLSPLK